MKVNFFDWLLAVSCIHPSLENAKLLLEARLSISLQYPHRHHDRWKVYVSCFFISYPSSTFLPFSIQGSIQKIHLWNRFLFLRGSEPWDWERPSKELAKAFKGNPIFRSTSRERLSREPCLSKEPLFSREISHSKESLQPSHEKLLALSLSGRFISPGSIEGNPNYSQVTRADISRRLQTFQGRRFFLRSIRILSSWSQPNSHKFSLSEYMWCFFRQVASRVHITFNQ